MGSFLAFVSQEMCKNKKLIPSVFVTAKHHNPGLKRDTASSWIEDVTQPSCKVCLSELQNYAESHKDVVVVSNDYLEKSTFIKRSAFFI